MLTLTDSAVEAVRGIVADSPELPEDGGLRLFGEATVEGTTQLRLAATEGPLEGDEVIEEEGARVFLDQEIVPALEDKQLDAELSTEGIRFRLLESE